MPFSHFDAVRAIRFHPVEPAILTGSEDHTVKLWNLNKTLPMRKYGLCSRSCLRFVFCVLCFVFCVLCFVFCVCVYPNQRANAIVFL